MYPAVLVGGIITTVVGVILAALALRQMVVANARRALLIATPTTPIATTPAGRFVEIRGTVGPSEQGLLVSPASGRHAVFYRGEVWNIASTPTRHESVTDRREFWLRDESGAHARILPDQARLELPMLRYVPGQSRSVSLD